MDVDELTAAERVLWAAFPHGTWADLRTGVVAEDDPAGGRSWGPSRTIRAEVVAALLLGVCDAERGYGPAVRLRGARVSGRLDLMGVTLSCPLVCEHCSFESAPRLVESVTRTVRIVDSHLPGFNGTRMRLDGILNLASSSFGSVIRLDQAKVTGQLTLRGARVAARPGEAAVAAESLVVDGNADLARLSARGPLWLEGMQVSGTVDLSGTQVTSTQERAITLSNSVVGGRLVCDGMTAVGQVRLHNTRIGSSFVLTGATLSAPPGAAALSAGGLAVQGGVFCGGDFTVDGEVTMVGARLAANLAMGGAVLRNPGKVALNLDRAEIGECVLTGIECEGQIKCAGTRIASGLSLADARLASGSDQPALAADGLTVGGTVRLTRLRAQGEVSFRTSHVGQRVLLQAARLSTPGAVALRFSRAEIGADLFCQNMEVTGGTRLFGAKVGGDVNLRQAQLVNPTGKALDAAALQADQLTLTTGAPVQGAVDLSHARVGLLTDDPAHWPVAIDLRGLTYQALEPKLSAHGRLRWLARQPLGHEPQPYEQLAAHYDSLGQHTQARHVLYVGERRQRAGKPPLGWVWNLVQDITVGYGYQPWRAVLWLAVLLATGSLVFHAHQPQPLAHGAAPHFNAVVYTLDLLLPVVNLGQKYNFNPAGALQWFSYLLMAAGGVLATTIAAGAARLLSRK
ncbi:MAG TPA: hypothetical protein VGS19_17010 [Streptosporangiaceae bacterium]|nr:hypothetical protein [Streptosporangiaceae bacterium]